MYKKQISKSVFLSKLEMLSKQTKISSMIGLTFLFFLVELITGYVVGSIALVADSFHMLSDVIALVIALYATKLAKSKTAGPEYSFGLQRAEVLGALINGVSLLALSATLIIGAIQRFFNPEVIDHPWMVLYVGSGGLLINIIGMFIFHDHGHLHSDQHTEKEGLLETSTAGHPKLMDLENPVNLNSNVVMVATLMQQSQSTTPEIEMLHRDSKNLSSTATCSESHNHDTEKAEADGSHHGHSHSPGHKHDHAASHGHSHNHDDMNMHGVFLHILGDLLASIGVIISALLIIYVNQSWTIYVDPAISVLITLIIIKSTVPLVKSACYILLQATPKTVSVSKIREDILNIDGVLGVHELHVWQLSDSQIVASIHVVVPHPDSVSHNPASEKCYMELAEIIKLRLHGHGIHSTTVQPEFLISSPITDEPSITCLLRCASEDCAEKTCCPLN
ncbi:cation efflux protein [Globomyces pollinis-pini]|nr:cation efflux protein [Globomyces pollinis-pini]